MEDPTELHFADMPKDCICDPEAGTACMIEVPPCSEPGSGRFDPYRKKTQKGLASS